jgi:protease-4
MFTTSRPFSEEEWALVNGWLDHIYADFTGKVAEGRRMPADRVHELARGRVWTGADALANGLVDELGGLDRAAAVARRRAGLSATAPLRIYPRSSPLDRLRPSSGDSQAARLTDLLPAGMSFGAAEAWGPVWQLAAQTGLSPYGPLVLPGPWSFD